MQLVTRIYKTKPAIKEYVWAGTHLSSWSKGNPGQAIAEAWELSFNEMGPTLIDGGEHDGEPLLAVVGKEEIGKKAASFPFFPVLIKLIDSGSNLSVQVHPTDEYALEHEHQYGKTEMWHIIAAEKGAGLYIGFKKDTSEEEVREALKNDTIIDLLNFVEVKPGDNFFIPSGTVHAIGGGVTLIEIQQNSTLTYRLYDYNRLGLDGKPRALHIDQACKVIDYKKYEPITFRKPLLGECKYFTSALFDVIEGEIRASKDSFLSITFLEGEGTLDGMSYQKGTTFFLPAGVSGLLKGKGKYVATWIK